MATNDSFERRLKLTEQSIDKYGHYLMMYARSLCAGSSLDVESLYDEFWIHVLNRFREEHILHIGFLRRKLYQQFVDAWRKMKRDPVFATETIPEFPDEQIHDMSLDGAELKEAFFADHPVCLTPLQKDALFLWARYDLTYQEISQHLGKPLSTVADWVKLGRQAIIEYIENQ